MLPTKKKNQLSHLSASIKIKQVTKLNSCYNETVPISKTKSRKQVMNLLMSILQILESWLAVLQKTRSIDDNSSKTESFDGYPLEIGLVPTGFFEDLTRCERFFKYWSRPLSTTRNIAVGILRSR